MKYYRHGVTTTDLFIMLGDTPQWLNTHVDGGHSEEARTPMYCRIKPSGEIVLIHLVKWAYTSVLISVSEEDARTLDNALVDRIAGIERGEEEPRYHRTERYGYLQDPKRREKQ
jgi:hypothetical protein